MRVIVSWLMMEVDPEPWQGGSPLLRSTFLILSLTITTLVKSYLRGAYHNSHAVHIRLSLEYIMYLLVLVFCAWWFHYPGRLL